MLYILPHFSISIISGVNVYPKRVNLYSVLGGMTGYSFFSTMLSFSNSLSCKDSIRLEQFDSQLGNHHYNCKYAFAKSCPSLLFLNSNFYNTRYSLLPLLGKNLLHRNFKFSSCLIFSFTYYL